jgi:hypothetical protein
VGIFMVEKNKSEENKVLFLVSKLGKVSLQIGEKLGKVVTEFFMGKQPTKEERELNIIRRERKLKLKLIQEDAEFERDLELAEKGLYIPPSPVIKKETKEKKAGMFDNIGKYNPIADFEKKNSLGTNDFGISKKSVKKVVEPDFGLSGLGLGNKSPDFGLDEFVGTKNSNKTKR